MAKLTHATDRSGMLADLSLLVCQPFPSLDACLPIMLPVITRHLGVSAAFVSEVTPGALKFLGAVDASNCGLLAATSEPILESFCQYVYATAAPMVVGDTSLDPRVTSVGLRHKYSIGSYVGVPIIRSSGAIYGTLCALDPEPRTFDDDQLAFLRVLGSKLAWVIEQPADSPPPAPSAAPGDDPALLLRVLAHDIRSPLTSILGYCEMLKSGMIGQITADQAAIITSIDESSRFIHRLATDMVSSVDSRRGAVALLVDRYDPVQLIRTLARIYQPQAAAKGLSLSVVAEAPLPECVGDAVRVQHALSNLVANAIAYTDHGAIRIRAAADADWVVYSVSDTGCGIAAADCERIWQLNARAHDAQPGFGIGLYMVRQLVAGMQGTVEVASTPGRGSTFTIRLPRLLHRPASIAVGG